MILTKLSKCVFNESAYILSDYFKEMQTLEKPFFPKVRKSNILVLSMVSLFW
jgi:hypothetical protein